MSVTVLLLVTERLLCRYGAAVAAAARAGSGTDDPASPEALLSFTHLLVAVMKSITKTVVYLLQNIFLILSSGGWEQPGQHAPSLCSVLDCVSGGAHAWEPVVSDG